MYLQFLIQALPPDTKVYQGVGRCFIAATIPEVRESLTKSISELEEKVRVLDVRRINLDLFLTLSKRTNIL